MAHSAPDAAEFVAILTSIVRRFHLQNDREPPPAAELQALAGRLLRLIEERGLPPPLAPGDPGKPGGMAESECAPLVARVLGAPAASDGARAEGGDPLLVEAARQLVKACFYPAFTNCRDSFREVAGDGVCRRQQLSRARLRVSGSHCVDCPHWVALGPVEHAALLAENWCADTAQFQAARAVFLPEDFRALRRWLGAAARH